MLKFLLLLVLVAPHASLHTYVTLHCSFTSGPFYSIVGNAYQCKVQVPTAIVSESAVIDSVNGVHHDVNSNAAVGMLWVWGTIFHYIPGRIGLHLPNLEAIWIHFGGLKALKYENMRQFPKLRYLYAGFNSLEVLAPDVLKGNPKMEWIDLQNNRLRFVDGAILTAFPLLQNLNLKKNYCIDKHHYGKVKHVNFDHLKNEIDMNCHLENELFCAMQNVNHQGANYFTCSGKGTAVNGKNVTLLRVLHNQKLTVIPDPLNDTQGLYIRYQNFTHFPVNLHEFLPNLLAIQIIGCKLQELSASDLMNFTELRSLWLPLNRIEVLRNDTFEHSRMLEKLSLYGNRLRVIESHALMPLQQLKFVSLEKNNCTDVAAEGAEIHTEITAEIAGNCD